MAKASRITGKGKYLMNARNSQFIVYLQGGGLLMLLFRSSSTIFHFGLYSLVPYKKKNSIISVTVQEEAEIGRVHGWEQEGIFLVLLFFFKNHNEESSIVTGKYNFQIVTEKVISFLFLVKTSTNRILTFHLSQQIQIPAP